MAWDYKTGTPRWRPDRADDMPGGPTDRKPFSDESKDYGWTPYDRQAGLGHDPVIVAAPAGYFQLWIIDGNVVQSPIVAWEIHQDEHATIEWITMMQVDEYQATAVLLPDGRVIVNHLGLLDNGSKGQRIFGNPGHWAAWFLEEE